jgi:predicted HTH domain antitoxin
MEITLRIPDDIAKRLSAAGGDVSRRALEALAIEGYRDQTLTLYQISEMLGLSRVETEDFLGRHQVPLAVIDEAALDREEGPVEVDCEDPAPALGRDLGRSLPGSEGEAVGESPFRVAKRGDSERRRIPGGQPHHEVAIEARVRAREDEGALLLLGGPAALGQREGLVEQTTGLEDRRTRLLSLTPAGRTLRADALPACVAEINPDKYGCFTPGSNSACYMIYLSEGSVVLSGGSFNGF